MHTTIDFLDMLKAKRGGVSDYAIAKLLGSHSSRICNIRKRGNTIDDLGAIVIAKALEMNPGYVLACVHYERATDPAEKQAWLDAAQALQ